MYANGPLFLSMSLPGSSKGLLGADDSKALKIGAGYAFGDTKVGFVYEDLNKPRLLATALAPMIVTPGW
jgi:hypothetical protein